MNKRNLTITSKLDNIKEVERFIEKTIEEFKIPGSLRNKISLSIIEAVNNSILFGNKQNPQKVVKLEAIKSPRQILFTVEDEGEGFDFNNIPDPTTPENSEKTTGRGLYLMAHLANELLFDKNGAKITLIFPLAD